MALFSRKTKEEQKAAAPAAAPVSAAPVQAGANFAHILSHARITEKASDVATSGIYVFDVAAGATKRDISLAVKELYSVTPRKIAVVNVKSKLRRNMRTGRAGVKKGGRKAYVYLKSGDTITIA